MNKPYKENTILFPLFVLLTLLCLFIMLAQAFAEPDDNFIFEERKDNQWTIDKAMMPNDVLVLSVNGQVTHGDRLQYRMMNNCNSINILTTFITGDISTNIKAKDNLLANAKYNEEDIRVSIPFVTNSGPFHFVWVDLGWSSVGKIKNYHQGVDTIKLTLQDRNPFKVGKFLTINKTNSWTTQGMVEALDRAVQHCKDSQRTKVTTNDE